MQLLQYVSLTTRKFLTLKTRYCSLDSSHDLARIPQHYLCASFRQNATETTLKRNSSLSLAIQLVPSPE